MGAASQAAIIKLKNWVSKNQPLYHHQLAAFLVALNVRLRSPSNCQTTYQGLYSRAETPNKSPEI